MARPQKFRHSREALNDPQIAAKLGGFVLDIEALRTTRKQIDDQIAAAYDAVGDAGFEKKFVRKVVSLRAKETDARRDEEEGLEAYEFAVEKGVSLASARSKPVSSQSYAEAKGGDRPAKKIEEGLKEAIAVAKGEDEPARWHHAPSELTDTQEQPEEPATKSTEQPTAAARVSTPAANTHGQTGTADRPARGPVPASAKAVAKKVGQSEQEATVELPVDTHSPSPANTPRLAIADDEAAQANPIVVGNLSSSVAPPPPGDTDKAGETVVSIPASPANSFNNPRCQHPDTCSHAHDQGSCDDCFFDWAKRPLEEQRRLWAEAMEAASETETA